MLLVRLFGSVADLFPFLCCFSLNKINNVVNDEDELYRVTYNRIGI